MQNLWIILFEDNISVKKSVDKKIVNKQKFAQNLYIIKMLLFRFIIKIEIKEKVFI